MPVIIGTDNVSQSQRRMLSTASSDRYPVRIRLQQLSDIIDDEDIQSGEENLLPQWLEVAPSLADLRMSSFERRLYERYMEFFSQFSPIDEEVYDIDASNCCITFVLGAGASQPDPSGIPTVKELLPDMLERAR
ncbi:MAG: hypothetical protein JSV77_04960 [Dehalococcoidales bacterium]|nr:MAG: hypothetical protein JSV77_04960 [Dehalococcoidales bacterium]